MQVAAESIIRDLKTGVTPSILNLNRCISQGAKHYSELAQVNEDFQKKLKTMNDMRKLLKHRMLEIRAHEELMNTIDMQ